MVRGKPRALAHLPLPSMMMATCSGTVEKAISDMWVRFWFGGKIAGVS
jgi:hypothetical protein